MSYCFFTEEGFKKIKGEVDELERYIKIDIAKALATAAAHGDLRENAEYAAAKENQAVSMAKLKEMRERIMKAHHEELRFCGSREPQQAVDNGIDSHHFRPDQIEERVTKFWIFMAFGKKLRECLDRDQRVLDFVRHPGRQRAQAGKSVGTPDLVLEPLDRRHVAHEQQRAPHIPPMPADNGTADPHGGDLFIRPLDSHIAVMNSHPSLKCFLQSPRQRGR